jgi:hypothetical protein
MEAKGRQSPFTAYPFGRLHCVLLLLVFFATGCATPIGVTRGSTQDTYYALTRNVLSVGSPSSWSTQVLHRLNLTEGYHKNPETASSPARWAEMYNEITHDPVLRGRYQVWFPVQYRAADSLLRHAAAARFAQRAR